MGIKECFTETTAFHQYRRYRSSTTGSYPGSKQRYSNCPAPDVCRPRDGNLWDIAVIPDEESRFAVGNHIAQVKWRTECIHASYLLSPIPIGALRTSIHRSYLTVVSSGSSKPCNSSAVNRLLGVARIDHRTSPEQTAVRARPQPAQTTVSRTRHASSVLCLLSKKTATAPKPRWFHIDDG